MTSSNRPPTPCDAVLIQDAHSTGPLKLPLDERERFIQEFNATYASLGMSVLAIESGRVVIQTVDISTKNPDNIE